MKNQNEQRHELLEQATRERLARLKAMPVDTARLEQFLYAAIDEATAAEGQKRKLLQWSALPKWSALSGLAAAIVLAASLLTVTIGSESPAVAAPVHLAHMHQAMLSGQVPLATADDASAIARLLNAEWRGDRTLQALPKDLVPLCCLMHIGGEPVLAAMIDYSGTPIGVVVADAEKVRPGRGATILRGGRHYVVQESAGTNMVITEVAGRFLCVMGSVPSGELIQLVEQALAERHGEQLQKSSATKGAE